jgi:hypothetical protein
METIKIIKEIGRNPHIDWIWILATSLIIFFTLGFVSLTLYNDVTNGSIHTSEVSTPASFKKLNEKVVTDVIERFSDKKELSQEARRGYGGESDPSM